MRLRLTAAVVAVVMVLVGCTPAEEPAPPPTGLSGDVVAAREALGPPMVELAEAVLALEATLAEARYGAQRGAGMRAALETVTERLDDVDDAAADAAAAAEAAPVDAAAEIVADAADVAGGAVDAGRAEAAYLQRLQRLDRRLLSAAEQWDEPGSQSEVRASLAELAQDVARLRRQARRLRPVPEECTVMKRNRVQWARTVRRRTQRLAEQANSAGGSTYDELRAAFRRVPFGEEPRVADRDDRPCWQEESAIPQAADAMRAAVEDLEAALR